MADAPERLWLWPKDPEDGVDNWVSFPGQRYPSGSTEYIRADVARADAELAVAEAIMRVGLAVAKTEIGFHDGISGEWHPMSGPAIISACCAAIRALAPADALAEVQRLRDERDELRAAVEGLIAVLDRNDKKGPIPDVEMFFCWLAAQDVRAAFRKIAPKGEAT